MSCLDREVASLMQRPDHRVVRWSSVIRDTGHCVHPASGARSPTRPRWRQHMRKLTFAASVGLSLAVAVVVASCSGDAASDLLGAPDDSALGAAYSGGGWTPDVATAAATNDKVSICH